MDADPKSPIQQGTFPAFHAASCSGFAGVLPGMEDMDWHRPSDVVLTPDEIAADHLSRKRESPDPTE